MLVVLHTGVKEDVCSALGAPIPAMDLINLKTIRRQSHCKTNQSRDFPVLPQGSPAARLWHTYTAAGTPAQHSGFGGTGQLQVFYEGKHRAKPSRLPALLSSMPAPPAPHSSQLETSVHRPQG